MKNLKIISLFILLLNYSIGYTVTSESISTPTNPEHPKICLVLSGGGARGAAHIGVLKVLEEYRIPVHCITGTSMGALVGAAYASGTSVPEMMNWVKIIDTKLIINEDPPRAELAFRRKQDDYNIFIGPEFGLKDWQINYGKGLLSGVKLETILRKLAKAKGYRNFDKLPIPFRAAATNLVTGEPVIFSEGELANVMRASMSLPAIIVPAEYKDMMLVDGMLTNNLPIQAARDMGADIIIAVNVGTPLFTRKELTGIFGIANQMVGILTEQNVQKSLEELNNSDILISPNLNDYTTADFDKLPEIVPLGEVAARKVSSQLKALSLPKDEYNTLRAKQKIITLQDNSPITGIEFKNLKVVNPLYLESIMTTKPNEILDQTKLDRDISWLYGTGDFEHINYSLNQKSNENKILQITPIEKSWGPDYIRFGLGLSSDFQGGSYYNLLASYRKTWLNSYGAEWRTDLMIGRNSSLFSEFFQPIDVEQNFFIAPYALVKKDNSIIYQKRDRIASYDITSARLGLDIGSLFFRYGEFRLGLFYGGMNPKLDTGSEIYSPGDNHIKQGAFRSSLILDQLDNVHFPRLGWRAAAIIHNYNSAIGAEDNYTKWETEATGVYSLNDHTINIGLRAGDKLGSPSLPRYDMFQWGGFLQQSGYKTGQLYGENLKFGRLMYYHRIMPGTIFDGAFAGASVEVGKVGRPLVKENSDNILKSAGLFLAIDSPIGPVYLGYGLGEFDNHSFYFYLGRPVN